MVLLPVSVQSHLQPLRSHQRPHEFKVESVAAATKVEAECEGEGEGEEAASGTATAVRQCLVQYTFPPSLPPPISLPFACIEPVQRLL